MEEDIRILEEWLKELNEIFNKTHINNTKERKALEHLIKAYKELEEENKELMKLKENHDYSVDVVRQNTKLRYELLNSIPKAKVEEKIRSLDIKIVYIESQYSNGGQNCNSEYLSSLYQKQILEELLKDGGE